MEWLSSYIQSKLINSDETCRVCDIFKDYEYRKEFNVTTHLPDTCNCLKDETFMFCPRLGCKMPWVQELDSFHYLVDSNHAVDSI